MMTRRARPLRPHFSFGNGPRRQGCAGAGAKRVRVMDQPFSGTAVEAYRRSGIREAVEKAGGEMEIMSAAKYVSVNFPATARDLKSWKIYQEILKADVLINVPIGKRHGYTRLTFSMKNLMGTVEGPYGFHNALEQHWCAQPQDFPQTSRMDGPLVGASERPE